MGLTYRQRKAQKYRDWVRWIFVGISLIFLLWTILIVIKLLYLRMVNQLENKPDSLVLIPYIDPVKAAIAQKIETSKALFQSSLIVFGVLWGLVIAKKGEARLVFGRNPEIILFVLAHFALGASWYCHSEYLDALTAISANPNLPPTKDEDPMILDFRNDAYNRYLVYQIRLWFAGLLISGLTLFSAHVLSEASQYDA